MKNSLLLLLFVFVVNLCAEVFYFPFAKIYTKSEVEVGEVVAVKASTKLATGTRGVQFVECVGGECEAVEAANDFPVSHVKFAKSGKFTMRVVVSEFRASLKTSLA